MNPTTVRHLKELSRLGNEVVSLFRDLPKTGEKLSHLDLGNLVQSRNISDRKELLVGIGFTKLLLRLAYDEEDVPPTIQNKSRDWLQRIIAISKSYKEAITEHVLTPKPGQEISRMYLDRGWLESLQKFVQEIDAEGAAQESLAPKKSVKEPEEAPPQEKKNPMRDLLSKTRSLAGKRGALLEPGINYIVKRVPVVIPLKSAGIPYGKEFEENQMIKVFKEINFQPAKESHSRLLLLENAIVVGIADFVELKNNRQIALKAFERSDAKIPLRELILIYAKNATARTDLTVAGLYPGKISIEDGRREAKRTFFLILPAGLSRTKAAPSEFSNWVFAWDFAGKGK